jgi:quercetin dioxygenase-like cupin family protein
MNKLKLILQITVIGGALAAAFGAGMAVGNAPADASVKPVISQALPNVPGKRLTAVLVSYPPGGASASHKHAGSVFAYVLSGKIRSEVSTTGPARVYSAGEGFFESPGSVHRVSENASKTDPASLLAVFVADEGATLTEKAE